MLCVNHFEIVVIHKDEVVVLGSIRYDDDEPAAAHHHPDDEDDDDDAISFLLLLLYEKISFHK